MPTIRLPPQRHRVSERRPQYWKKQKVSFDAACNHERVLAWIFLPKNASPPYQTVVFFPGAHAVQEHTRDVLQMFTLNMVIKSGRALIYPIYKGTHERGDDLHSDYQNKSTLYRDHVIAWSKDLGTGGRLCRDPSRSGSREDRILWIEFWGRRSPGTHCGRRSDQGRRAAFRRS